MEVEGDLEDHANLVEFSWLRQNTYQVSRAEPCAVCWHLDAKLGRAVLRKS